ncbi:uncharacterized protein LOC119526515 isoform X2 [Choloepus didactylus]|uniref:uncharacterized protein LOC119526515 isoform X2 n=1 Tax=Choloepus didactylus TaxID=27675 RepID=UPI00189FB522|nr:uncharacterized protein LOC119526515 isoform X2 [Choloepus didactylus]
MRLILRGPKCDQWRSCPDLTPREKFLTIGCLELPFQLSSQPGMGPLLRGWSFFWASQLVCCMSLLQGTWSSGALGSGAWDSGAHSFLKQIQGGSVLFHVNKQGAEPEEISWGFSPESDYRIMMRVRRGAHFPTWISLQEKYKQRVHVPNMMSLRIEKLILEDSGQYRAQVSSAGGREFNHVFHLTVNEPVPQPQILTKPTSITTSWCNVTLECTAAGATEDLNVTWESKDLPGGLELRGTLGPVTSTSTLAVSLPLSQPTASITCGVSNSVDQKNATLDLGRVCWTQESVQQGPSSGAGMVLIMSDLKGETSIRGGSQREDAFD